MSSCLTFRAVEACCSTEAAKIDFPVGTGGFASPPLRGEKCCCSVLNTGRERAGFAGSVEWVYAPFAAALEEAELVVRVSRIVPLLLVLGR